VTEERPHLTPDVAMQFGAAARASSRKAKVLPAIEGIV
jgi:hypothetical protein